MAHLIDVEECPRTELPPEMCGCREHRGGMTFDELQHESRKVSFAEREGHCPGCDKEIKVGQRVRVHDRHYFHSTCA